MRIVICGAGEVGSHAAEVLDRAGHGVTVIDTDSCSAFIAGGHDRCAHRAEAIARVRRC